MQTQKGRNPWDSHDWKVKTLESLTPGGGSRLGYTCRSCGRKFGHMTINHRTWAVNDEGLSLSDEITSRWMVQWCAGHAIEADNKDRNSVKHPHQPHGRLLSRRRLSRHLQLALDHPLKERAQR